MKKRAKHYFLLLLLLHMFSCLNAQQWIAEKYSYDSTLHVSYGSAINFHGAVDTLKMDLYVPRCEDVSQTSKKPLLIWIHGGAFLAGDKNDASITRLCKQFARRGYVTASIDYRLGFVSDDAAWNCNFPNYSCVFASDSAEWIRAWYRGVQDAKGALRYLVNRNSQYKIDVNNIFVAGESAGALIALGVGLLDTVIERMPQTFLIAAAPNPNSNTQNCAYNAGKSFTSTNVPRPDLGGIDGNIEPTMLSYTIKGIGNNYGALLSNLLKYSKNGQTKPAIYSFHQPCDMVVPIDSGKVYAGLSWCMTNGYNCFGIANTVKLYGSRAFSNWNTNNNYGYSIQNEFTSTNFPYSFLFGAGSCADQVNNPCHGYDNSALRSNNLAAYFAPLVSTNPICSSSLSVTGIVSLNKSNEIQIYPNPASHELTLFSSEKNEQDLFITITDMSGRNLKSIKVKTNNFTYNLDLELTNGAYIIHITNAKNEIITKKLLISK